MSANLKLLNRVCFFSNKLETTKNINIYKDKNSFNVSDSDISNKYKFKDELKESLNFDDLKNNTDDLKNETNILNQISDPIDAKDVIKTLNENKMKTLMLEDDIIIKSTPDEVLKFELNPSIDYIIYNTDEYYRTRLNPPNANDYFKFGLGKFSITIKDDFPENSYMGNSGYYSPELPNGIKPTTIKDLDKYNYKNHWGQRKLLLTEIDFLNYCLKERDEKMHILYAGAAHGTHLPFLLQLFPNLIFHLYDPADSNGFDKNLIPYCKKGQIFINEYYHLKYKNLDKYLPFTRDRSKVPEGYGYFTNEVALYYKNKFFSPENNFSNLLFISDIRRGISSIKGESSGEWSWRFEEGVLKDQEMQQEWLRLLRPKYSMLKYKEPYVKEGRNKYYKHIKGTIRFQTWHPCNSAETRLIIRNEDIDRIVNYNILSYERKNAYYNYIRQFDVGNKFIKFIIHPNKNRPTTLKELCINVASINKVKYYTIDFYNEIYILYYYLNKFIKPDESSLFNVIIKIMRDITSLIDRTKRNDPNNFILSQREKNDE
jgi:hypothetical protein